MNGTIIAQGSGYNQIPRPHRMLIVNDIIIYEESNSRGLRFTVLENVEVIHDQVYDTFGSSVRADALAADIGLVTGNRAGVLTSFDAWESSITPELRTAFMAFNLRVAAQPTSEYRRPYAAIFTSTNAIEDIQNTEADSLPAIVRQSFQKSIVIPLLLVGTVISAVLFIGRRKAKL